MWRTTRVPCEHGAVRALPAPLPHVPQPEIAGFKIRNRSRPTAVDAYADDVTIFITAAADFTIVEAINLFQQASGARLNQRKSKALATGGWNTTDTIRGTEYYQSVTILGVTFWGTTRQSMDDTWARLTGKVRMQTKKAYDMDACIAHRMRYANTNLLSKFWSIVQISPAPRTYTRRITAAITWYTWKRAVFKVPTTLQRPNGLGGWEMTRIEAKCRALLLCRMYIQGRKDGTITAKWLRKWQLNGEQKKTATEKESPREI